MALTVRHRGQLLLPKGERPIDDVIAVVWFEQDEETGPWGGTVEPLVAAPLLRAQVAAGQARYRLCLVDGRSGLIDISLSEFTADGSQPIVFEGVGQLTRLPDPEA